MHNGTITNYEELRGTVGKKTDGECDSEVLLRVVDKFGIKKAMRMADGSKAIAHYDTSKKRLTLFKDANKPLYLAFLEDYNMYVFASTRDILENALVEEKVSKTAFGLFNKHEQISLNHKIYFINNNLAISFDMYLYKMTKVFIKIRRKRKWMRQSMNEKWIL